MEQKKEIDIDDLLTDEIGQFGWFQIKTILLAIVVVIFGAFHAEYVFTTARILTRCLIPECEDASNNDFAPEWITNAIPLNGQAIDECQRYNVNYTNIVDEAANETCPVNLFDTTQLVNCEQYVYENTNSVVYDYDLACDEWRRSLIGFARTFGTFFALPLTGYISDKWGRRTALAINGFNTAWIGLTRYWANTYTGFMISEVVEAVFGSGIFSCTYILVLEIVGPKYRIIAGAILSSSFAIGQMIMGFVAWLIPQWRPLTLALYIPQLLTIFYFWIITESVRWYLSKEKYVELETLLREIARMNKKQISAESIELLKKTAEEKKLKELEKEEKTDDALLIVLVFRHKQILLRCLILPICWITMTLVYYGLSINAVNMNGNQYINFVMVSLVEVPGFWIAVMLVNRIGRKPVLLTAYMLCAVCQFIYVCLYDDIDYTISLTVYLIGKCSIAAVTTALYLYTAELFPTKYRHNLFAYSSMMGRIGSIFAPLTPAVGAATFEKFPFVLFGSFALVSSVLLCFTPETLGTKMPDTLEDADNLSKTKK